MGLSQKIKENHDFIQDTLFSLARLDLLWRKL